MKKVDILQGSLMKIQKVNTIQIEIMIAEQKIMDVELIEIGREVHKKMALEINGTETTTITKEAGKYLYQFDQINTKTSIFLREREKNQKLNQIFQ